MIVVSIFINCNSKLHYVVNYKYMGGVPIKFEVNKGCRGSNSSFPSAWQKKNSLKTSDFENIV